MDLRTGFFALLLTVLGIIAFFMLAPFLQWVMAAGLLAFLLYPVHQRLSPQVGERISALVLTAFAFVAAVVPMLILSVLLLRSALSILDGIEPDDIIEAVETVREILIDQFGFDPAAIDNAEEVILEELESVIYASVETVLLEVVGLVNLTIQISLGLLVLAFLLYYFLVDGKGFLTWIRGVAPLDDEIVTELFEEIRVVTWAVIGSHILVAVVEGILGGIGLWIVGVPNVAFWTVVMIVVSILPVVGVWLVWAPAVGYLLFTGDVLGAVFLLVYGIAVLSVVDNYLRAVLVDQGSGLHPAVVLIGVLGGIYVLGILGLFLGPVLLAVFKASLDVFSRTQQDALVDGSQEGSIEVDEPGGADGADAGDG